MAETKIIDILTEFSLTRQEASIYAALLNHGDMTGYEVAKDTGFSRSNVYAALNALVEKAGVGQKDMMTVAEGMDDVVRSMKEMADAVDVTKRDCLNVLSVMENHPDWNDEQIAETVLEVAVVRFRRGDFHGHHHLFQPADPENRAGGAAAH